MTVPPAPEPPVAPPGPDATPAPARPTPLGGPQSRASKAWYTVARGIVEGVSLLMWRVEVHGRENVPKTGPFVLAPVHRSNIDFLICGCIVRRRVRFMGKSGLWKYKWPGKLFTSLGAYPVRRGTADREAMRTTEEALRGGEPVVLFPEGTRQFGPTVQPIMQGAVFVAARAGVPILPVGIGGSERAMPKGSKWVRPVKVVAVVGPVIPPPAGGGPGGRVSRKAVAAVSDQLHTELQRLFDEAQHLAGAG
ncbi:MAG TPA: lysophospholipid acyltransferase family protein [Acidimicrobiales bacterium]|nr:lysophospholipid acyltransferase family protein [Acidimicrobiales bacterium]